MGRLYSIIMDAATIAAAKDLISVTVASDKVLILHELNVTQEASETSDTGVIQIHRATGTLGVGAATPPRALDSGDAAMGGTVLTNLTTDETEGNILLRRAWNVLSGFHWMPTPESRVVVPGQGIIAVRSDVAITSATVTAELIVEELG